MNFLAAHGCGVEFREFRTEGAVVVVQQAPPLVQCGWVRRQASATDSFTALTAIHLN